MNWDTIFESLIVQVLVPFLAIVAIPLLGKLLKEYFSTHGKVLRYVKAGVKFAEETGLDVISEEKLAIALDFIQEALHNAGYTNVDIDVLVSAIEGEVATSLNMDLITSE